MGSMKLDDDSLIPEECGRSYRQPKSLVLGSLSKLASPVKDVPSSLSVDTSPFGRSPPLVCKPAIIVGSRLKADALAVGPECYSPQRSLAVTAPLRPPKAPPKPPTPPPAGEPPISDAVQEVCPSAELRPGRLSSPSRETCRRLSVASSTVSSSRPARSRPLTKCADLPCEPQVKAFETFAEACEHTAKQSETLLVDVTNHLDPFLEKRLHDDYHVVETEDLSARMTSLMKSSSKSSSFSVTPSGSPRQGFLPLAHEVLLGKSTSRCSDVGVETVLDGMAFEAEDVNQIAETMLPQRKEEKATWTGRCLLVDKMPPSFDDTDEYGSDCGPNRAAMPASPSLQWQAIRQPPRGLVRSKGEEEGTIGNEPKSPPVLGRSLNIQLEAAMLVGGSSLMDKTCSAFVPKLRKDVEASICNRTPWPTESDDVGPGRKARAAEESSEAPTVYTFLRGSFADIDLDSNRRISEEEFTEFVMVRACKQNGWQEVPEELQDLLRASAKRSFRQVAMREAGLLLEDWLHFGLVLTSAPSRLAQYYINQHINRQLLRSPGWLKEVLYIFETADVRGTGRLRAADMEATFANGRALTKDMRLSAQHEVGYYDFVVHCLGLPRSEVRVNWYDVSNGVARWILPRLLGDGYDCKGIWHTGIVVFGKEYWYGGRVLSSEPGQAPFPPGPVRTTLLGHTSRTREELEDFLRFEMAPRYTRDKYDVLRRNCNHFTDELCAFLIEGARLPEEARLQPERLTSMMPEGIRPVLNNWLGGFEAEASPSEIDDLMPEWRVRLWPGDLAFFLPHVREPEHMRLVQVYNVDALNGLCNVTYFEPTSLQPTAKRPHAPSPKASDAMVVDEGVDDILCSKTPQRSQSEGVRSDVRVLRLGACVISGSYWSWTLKELHEVPLACLRPQMLYGKGLFGSTGAGLSHLVRVMLRFRCPEVLLQLQRKAIVYAHCPQGHSMKPVVRMQRRKVGAEAAANALETFLAASPIICGICCCTVSGKGETVLECQPCGFFICSHCDRKGTFRGYYSLGSVDTTMAKALLQDTEWVKYKAMRYIAAAGAGEEGTLEIEVWLHKVSGRLYADLGTDPPSKADLEKLFVRFVDAGTASRPRGSRTALDGAQFTALVMELLAVHADLVQL
eukprot:TRINITY_DN91680_c0_g1_i1.p1 TRINITY_DN91680_c0_g1~~TRINITY_DN91680_c0_g1_i1.p1  ORF type:complete len:1131 (+),score=190.38 TRINITY_DN91680_c0_g1_i1:183-3575(+)